MNLTCHAATRALIWSVAIGVFAWSVGVAAQQPAAQTAAPGGTPSAGAKPYVPAKTAWNEPDITGMFNFSYVGTVPLERCGGGGVGLAPTEYRAKVAPPAAAEPAGPRGAGAGAPGGGRGGGRGGPPCDPKVAFVPEDVYQQRLAAFEKQQAGGDRFENALKDGDLKTALGGIVDPTTPQRQTSLIVDPPDGRLPALTPEGSRRMMLAKSSWSWFDGEPQVWDHWTDFDHWDRCITRGLPASMGPYRYNNGMRILQAPGMVVLDLEMIHEARIIYTDGRANVPSSVQQYMGESRGRWENGNTLVITTTGIKPGASMTNIGVAGSPAGNRIPTSDQLKVTERIRATGPGMIEYEITTDDPVILTRPWTARFPLKDDPTYEWWYACHEGNTAIPNYINSSRAERAAAAKEAGQPQPAAPAGGRGGR